MKTLTPILMTLTLALAACGEADSASSPDVLDGSDSSNGSQDTAADAGDGLGEVVDGAEVAEVAQDGAVDVPVEVASCEGVVCGPDASCAVVNGVVACGCDAGYSGDGETCASICGDGLVVADEACDDSNTEAGDGCRADCAGLELCGDGLIDAAEDETCDDGNVDPGDGCDDRCELEPVEGPCGDGVLNIGEECDDGNDIPDDGCEACVVSMSDLWTCDPAVFGADDGCECGCGQLDPDCEDATVEACEFCGGEGACDPQDVGCQDIDPSANYLCK